MSVYERAFQGGKRWIAPITAFMAYHFSDKPIFPLPEQLQSLFTRFQQPLLAGVALVGAVWALLGPNKIHEDRLKLELSRLREPLANDVKRLLERVLRDWQARASQYVREVQKAIGQEIEELVRSALTDQVNRDRHQHSATQQKIGISDNRLRGLSGFLQQVSQLRKSALECRQVLEQAVRDVLAGPKMSGG